MHTLKPGNALNTAQRYGEFIKLKIENMQEQHNSIIESNEKKAEPVMPQVPEKEVNQLSVLLLVMELKICS